MRNDISARAREIALTLTSWPSVTGSADEAAIAPKLARYLSHFDTVWTSPIPKDARSNVFALKRGRSRRTIVLTGHFDVVPVDDYGALEPLAFNAERLLPEIVARLRKTGENALALADFESGEFLPGRGLLDMKAGLAAGIAAMEAYTGDASLLFLGVSDEEERSAGARAAAPMLSQIASEHDLDIALVINLDAISDQGDGALGRTVALGSVGKQLVTALVTGKEAHACYPQDGANAAYLAAELLTEFELAPELAETSGAEIAAPPTALHAKDLKSGYNVTTPAQSWLYWNTLQHRRSAEEVFDISLMLARRAMARAARKLARDIPVMSYAELAARVPHHDVQRIAEEVAAIEGLDLPERAKRVTAAVWKASGLTGPAVVMGFGSIPYPAVSLSDAALEDAIAMACAAHGVGSLRYFPGISDMSFLGEASGDLSACAANTPIWGSSFTMPDSAGYPCINIGPWGRDYHHWLERLHAPYAFDTLPRVLLAVIEAVAKGR
ncbi:arginine utilization protein RocB [Aestuariivirga litoralis]|uniref:Arginine utilization protein RocB n=1 Tax=Aestuariivirga litoralis TaxID=2650924 RepID=A0A2W2B6Q3_9HYPH|nr:M20/M25/M40 family metallo-hydrolase [Aestuariivirga litoralis]PZF75738.1 arginine utilization protein RocB [Aestuariivirga litoralis]